MSATPRFLDADQVRTLRQRFATPLYVYDETTLRAAAGDVLAFPHAFGLTARYAMKASPNRAILRLFDSLGLHFDASSGYEVRRALLAGIAPAKISLSSQELPADFAELVGLGISINACSLDQLARFGRAFPGGRVGVRFNPGLGSGHSDKTNVGGPASSFGIWHEKLTEVRGVAEEHGLDLFRVHSHIGSGGDPAVWQRVADLTLALVDNLPSVTHVNLGGGYKIGRMPGETTTDLAAIGAPVAETFRRFADTDGRQLHLEIEPGTYLVGNAGALVATVIDRVDTGIDGYRFLKLDSGMTELLRPSLYAAQHPITLVPASGDGGEGETEEVVIVGHCCESGDLITPASGDSAALGSRTLPRAAIGDLAVIDGAGAYAAAMPAKNYNAFPEAAEVMIRPDGEMLLVRRRQTLEQIVANEITAAAAGAAFPAEVE